MWLEYANGILAFIIAALAVMGDTHDKDAISFRKIKPLGYMLIFVAFCSCAISIINVNNNIEKYKLREKTSMAVSHQIVTAVELLLRPMCGIYHTPHHKITDDEIYSKLQSQENLEAIRNVNIIMEADERKAFIPSLNGELLPLVEPYQLANEYIIDGLKILNVTLDLFEKYFTDDEILAIYELTQDNFLRNNYVITKERINNSRKRIDFGYYYFDAEDGIYLLKKHRHSVESFISKAKKVTELIRGNQIEKTYFLPCSVRSPRFSR